MGSLAALPAWLGVRHWSLVSLLGLLLLICPVLANASSDRSGTGRVYLKVACKILCWRLNSIGLES